MPDEKIDVLMRIVGTSGPFKGESRTEFKVNSMVDSLRQLFTPGYFSELRTFNFQAGLTTPFVRKEEPRTEDTTTDLDNRGNKPQSRQQQRQLIVSKQNEAFISQRSKLAAVDMQPVTFSRTMESSSTLLFKALVGCETLEAISVVKRKSSGHENSGMAYLRLDFNKVLMTNLQWEDEDEGHVMVETGTFIYRNVVIRYRKQLADGSLGPEIAANWTMKTV